MTGTATVARTEPGAIRLAGTLGLAGLLSGLMLVLAYEFTLPRIERNHAEALERAVFLVVPQAKVMQKLVWQDSALKVADGSEPKDAPAIFAAYDDQGSFRGYAIRGAGQGFQDVIELLFGFDPQARQIVGLRVLQSRETPGLGDKIYKDPDFAHNFDALAVEPRIVAVKKGARAHPGEIDAITGATISSKAVAKILEAACEQWLGRLPPAGSEPALPKRGGG